MLDIHVDKKSPCQQWRAKNIQFVSISDLDSTMSHGRWQSQSQERTPEFRLWANLRTFKFETALWEFPIQHIEWTMSRKPPLSVHGLDGVNLLMGSYWKTLKSISVRKEIAIQWERARKLAIANRSYIRSTGQSSWLHSAWKRACLNRDEERVRSSAAMSI